MPVQEIGRRLASSAANVSSGPVGNVNSLRATCLLNASQTDGPTADSSSQQQRHGWVNTDSSIYHKPGSRWYGKTKQGKYMSEADAQKAGYRASEKN
jgi:hypothetical protein